MHIWKNTNDKDAQEMHCQSNSLSVSPVNYDNTVPSLHTNKKYGNTCYSFKNSKEISANIF